MTRTQRLTRRLRVLWQALRYPRITAKALAEQQRIDSLIHHAARARGLKRHHVNAVISVTVHPKGTRHEP